MSGSTEAAREDCVIAEAAAILERRGYPLISSEILWAIGQVAVDV